MYRTPTILVVDDEVAVTTILADLLNDAGYRTVIAANGAQALMQVRATGPDLVLTDVMMPMLSGIQLCRALAADPTTEGIPVILMSAGARRAAVLECPAAHFLAKPFEVDELLGLVARLIGPDELAERVVSG